MDGEWRVLDTCSGTIEQSFQHTSYVMSNLKPDTTYKVELRAHNAIGDSTPAEVRIRTARGENDKYYNYYFGGASRATLLFPLLLSVVSLVRVGSLMMMML